MDESLLDYENILNEVHAIVNNLNDELKEFSVDYNQTVGNKKAAQRARVRTIKIEKMLKQYRKLTGILARFGHDGLLCRRFLNKKD